MSGARFVVGSAIEMLREMPDDSVDLVLTSSPFLNLRSYLLPNDPNKGLELGAEATPGAFIDALLDHVEELRRVLAPHGTLAWELGDTYAGSGGSGGDYNEGGLREGQAKWQGTGRSSREEAARIPWRANDEEEEERTAAILASRRYSDRSPRPKYANNGRDRDTQEEAGIIPVRSHSRVERDGWPLDKSLCMVPELLRVAMAYGVNPLTGRQTPRWRLRNIVRWCRPNPPVGALVDKVRPATTDIVVACIGRRRYFDLDAVRTPLTEPGAIKSHSTEGRNPSLGWKGNNAKIVQNEAGAPPLDHWWHDDSFDQDAWMIPTATYRGQHYATWPPALLVTPIEAMCPRRVCKTCGEPSRRIIESERVRLHDGEINPPRVPPTRNDGNGSTAIGVRHGIAVRNTTTGWTDCGHDDWRAGVVLDPFAGSGTTLAVATGHGRDAIGIDLDERNADLARQRVGMFLEVVERQRPKAVEA